MAFALLQGERNPVVRGSPLRKYAQNSDAWPIAPASTGIAGFQRGRLRKGHRGGEKALSHPTRILVRREAHRRMRSGSVGRTIGEVCLQAGTFRGSPDRRGRAARVRLYVAHDSWRGYDILSALGNPWRTGSIGGGNRHSSGDTHEMRICQRKGHRGSEDKSYASIRGLLSHETKCRCSSCSIPCQHWHRSLLSLLHDRLGSDRWTRDNGSCTCVPSIRRLCWSSLLEGEAGISRRVKWDCMDCTGNVRSSRCMSSLDCPRNHGLRSNLAISVIGVSPS